VERVILKAMAKAPEDRYQTAEEMVEALERAVAGVPVVERPPEVKPVPVEEVPSAVIVEPTPAPAVTVPVEAPPVTKKGLPGWAWGLVGVLVLLIAAGGVFLATQGEKPSPTPAATAALAATPIPEMGADLWVYDDFNNPAHEGSYDQGLWELRADPAQVAQRDGAMVFTQQNKLYQGMGLAATRYSEISLDRPTFFEARLMLSPDANAGNVNLDLRTELSPDETWYAECPIDSWEGKGSVGCFNEAIRQGQGEVTYGPESIPVPFGSWHTVRMEVDPATMTFKYFVDGQLFGSHTPLDADRLKKARFTLSIGIYQHSTGALTGCVDDVRVGLLEAPIAAPSPPAPMATVSPGSPPMDAIEVEPCQWDDRGPGLCIFPLQGDVPTRILTDTELDLSGGGQPSWSPDGRQIAFSAVKPGERPDHDSTIYIVNADGTGLTELPPMGNDVRPAWSPDGEWLAFHSSGDLAIMRPDGSDPTVIWHGEGCTEEPQWSPDSQWIAVVVQIEGCEWTFPMTREVRVISRDGATTHTVATITHENGECVWSEVAFSPDGKQVAYNDANCKPWIVNADGSGQAMPLEGFPFWWKSTVHPQWEGKKGASPPAPRPVSPGSPPTDAMGVTPCQWDDLGPGLCISPLRGGPPTKILEDTELEISGPPSWSPDGRQIAFSALEPGESPDRDTTIYIVNADGSGLTELPSLGNDINPAWSSDGEWLAFHSNCSLAIMHPDGSAPTVIWDSEGRTCTFEPQWSPDSQWIVVFMQMEGDGEWTFPMRRELWVISHDGATVTTVATITHEDDSCMRPDVAFSPDGTQVAYYDAGCQPWIVNADGSGQAAPLTDFPGWWTSMVHQQ
jgi:Tol biopolymer transport system component